MSFDDTTSVDADAKFTLTPSDVASGTAHALTSSRFRKFTRLAIFVEDNQGVLDQTVITKLVLAGGVRGRPVRSRIQNRTLLLCSQHNVLFVLFFTPVIRALRRAATVP